MRYRASSFVALITISLASSIVVSSAALAADTYYISPAEIDLVHILAPPPIPDSPTGKADLQAVLATVNARTDASIKQAQDDDQRTVFRFADVMGPNFKTENSTAHDRTLPTCLPGWQCRHVRRQEFLQANAPLRR